MKILKKHKYYDCMSEPKINIKSKNWLIDIQEFYGKSHTFTIRLWRQYEDQDVYINKRSITLPLNFYAFYILYIYKHLGKCHPDLRSKFYIGKPVEMKGEK